MKKYREFNESKKHRQSRNKYNFNNFPINAQPNEVKMIERGMPMDFSNKFNYILSKMVQKNNGIAKELINLPNDITRKFEYSYIDLARNNDTLSYLANGDRNIPEDDRYSSIKRQNSKIHKVIKAIFGNKYTKNEIAKFVSIYKEIYAAGPDESLKIKSKQSNSDISLKLIKDTKDNKLLWDKIYSNAQLNKYESTIKITEKKYLKFEFFNFFLAEYEKNSFITIHLIKDFSDKGNNKNNSEWITTLQYDDIKNFVEQFVSKKTKK